MDETGSNRVARTQLGARDSSRASRRWWDRDADDYQREHGEFLGDAEFTWGPEGWTEADLHILGPLTDLRDKAVLEIGCGAAQSSRWLRSQGVRAIGLDLSIGQLGWAGTLDYRTAIETPVVLGDAVALPIASASIDVAFSAYGAVQFVGSLDALTGEVARVLRAGGMWVYSITHPLRWCFPDDPGPGGLVARNPYWDRRAYVEYDEMGAPSYVEHHRTLGDHVRSLTAANLTLVDLLEPEWPARNPHTWGGWSPERGAVLPGTVIVVARRN